ncbi:MAG: hypothetical protein IAF94_07205 [Pirellulaceae bacterium]|nr:hypothetical protein [Pirellulaceae bacterium]
MKYSLRSLMIAVLVLPPLLAWGWWGWQSLQEKQYLDLGYTLPLLTCPTDDYADDVSDNPLADSADGGRVNP